MKKRGGKRLNAGRPNRNSVRRNITLPIELDNFAKENKYSLSKLTQQKIKEHMNERILEIKVLQGKNNLMYQIIGACNLSENDNSYIKNEISLNENKIIKIKKTLGRLLEAI